MKSTPKQRLPCTRCGAAIVAKRSTGVCDRCTASYRALHCSACGGRLTDEEDWAMLEERSYHVACLEAFDVSYNKEPVAAVEAAAPQSKRGQGLLRDDGPEENEIYGHMYPPNSCSWSGLETTLQELELLRSQWTYSAPFGLRLAGGPCPTVYDLLRATGSPAVPPPPPSAEDALLAWTEEEYAAELAGVWTAAKRCAEEERAAAAGGRPSRGQAFVTHSLEGIVQRIQAMGLLRERTHRFKSYRACLVGRELVEYLLCGRYAASREDAIAIGRSLIACGMMASAFGGDKEQARDFEDREHAYYVLLTHHQRQQQYAQQQAQQHAGGGGGTPSGGSSPFVHGSAESGGGSGDSGGGGALMPPSPAFGGTAVGGSGSGVPPLFRSRSSSLLQDGGGGSGTAGSSGGSATERVGGGGGGGGGGLSFLSPRRSFLFGGGGGSGASGASPMLRAAASNVGSIPCPPITPAAAPLAAGASSAMRSLRGVGEPPQHPPSRLAVVPKLPLPSSSLRNVTSAAAVAAVAVSAPTAQSDAPAAARAAETPTRAAVTATSVATRPLGAAASDLRLAPSVTTPAMQLMEDRLDRQPAVAGAAGDTLALSELDGSTTSRGNSRNAGTSDISTGAGAAGASPAPDVYSPSGRGSGPAAVVASPASSGLAASPRRPAAASADMLRRAVSAPLPRASEEEEEEEDEEFLGDSDDDDGVDSSSAQGHQQRHSHDGVSAAVAAAVADTAIAVVAPAAPFSPRVTALSSPGPAAAGGDAAASPGSNSSSLQSVGSPQSSSRQLISRRLELEGRLVRAGWLTKQGHRVRNWKRRWFVLQGAELSYYRRGPHATSGLAGQLPAKTVDVRGFTLQPGGTARSPWALRLVPMVRTPAASAVAAAAAAGAASATKSPERAASSRSLLQMLSSPAAAAVASPDGVSKEQQAGAGSDEGSETARAAAGAAAAGGGGGGGGGSGVGLPRAGSFSAALSAVLAAAASSSGGSGGRGGGKEGGGGEDLVFFADSEADFLGWQAALAGTAAAWAALAVEHTALEAASGARLMRTLSGLAGTSARTVSVLGGAAAAHDDDGAVK